MLKMNKNNLEKLFREKLNNFSDIPNDSVWESISATLDKKKKKRVIPIWWKLSGIAASLAILLYLTNPFTENTTPVPQITDIENTSIKDATTIDGKQPENKNSSPNTELVNSNSTSPTKNSIPKENNNSIKNKASYTTNSTNPNSINNSIKTPKNRANELLVAATTKTEKDKSSKNNSLAYNKYPEETLEGDKKLASSKAIKNQEKLISKDGLKQLGSKNEVPISSTAKKDEKKSIFEVIEKQEEEEVAIVENKKSNWSVGPSIAPVYFDAIGQGSPIHPDFIQNSKSGNINLSYGLAVAYDLGKRLKIRSGINKIDYGYETNEVAFSSSISQSSVAIINNIDFSESSKTIVLESKRTNSSSLSDAVTNGFSQESLSRDGNISQQIGYLEVPLELNYLLIDKKVGVNLIGGVSSLFLIDNSVAIQSNNLVTEIGEANNVNSVNFSTNLGVGFSYTFTPKIQLSLEPVFKYQLNTFSNTSGNFNPYSVGIYSGVRVGF